MNPFNIYAFLILVFGLVTLFIAIKIFLERQKSRHNIHSFGNGMKAGNAQSIGQQEEQNDYFTILPNEFNDSFLAVIADGTTKKKTGKYAAVITVEILKANFLNNLHNKLGIDKYFHSSFDAINKRLNDNIYGNKVGATLIAAIVQDGYLYFSSVGNCVLFLYRNKEMITLNDIEKNEIQISEIKLKMNDIVMLCSQGIYKSLTEMEILHELSKKIHPYEKCQNFVNCIQNKRFSYQDNATIIILENMDIRP